MKFSQSDSAPKRKTTSDHDLTQCIRILRELLAKDLDGFEYELVNNLIARYQDQLGTVKSEIH